MATLVTGRRGSADRYEVGCRRRWRTARGRASGSALAALVGALIIGLVTAPAAPMASANPRSSADIQRELDALRGESSGLSGRLGEVRQQIGSTEEQLAAVAVRLADARERLEAAEGQVKLAEVALVETEAERDRALERLEAALSALAATEAELAAEESRLAEHIVDSFKYGTAGAQRGAMVMEVVRRTTNPNDFAVAMKQVRTVIDVQEATVTRVTALKEQQDQRAAAADDAATEAENAVAEAADTLAFVDALREQAAEVAEEIADDERRQRSILSSLRGTAEETAALLARAENRERELREELAAARARESGQSDRSAFPGWAGGPDIAGAVCPVEGARAGRNFINDWGYPRWPDRWHQGNDIFAARGTAVVAVADAVVVRWNPPNRQTSLGGITLTYRTADGSEWYNAHLDSIASGIQPGVSVSRGQQIGTVGNTGNARTTPPHLHLGRRYDGRAVNPWPTVSKWC